MSGYLCFWQNAEKTSSSTEETLDCSVVRRVCSAAKDAREEARRGRRVFRCDSVWVASLDLEMSSRLRWL